MYKTYKHLLALISASVTFGLGMVYAFAFEKTGFFSRMSDLSQQVIPNLIASLLVFL
jgi:hypothetical protein